MPGHEVILVDGNDAPAVAAALPLQLPARTLPKSPQGYKASEAPAGDIPFLHLISTPDPSTISTWVGSTGAGRFTQMKAPFMM